MPTIPDVGIGRPQIVREVAAHLGISVDSADRVTCAFLDEIERHLDAGRRVTLRGFGAFAPKTRPARDRVNPGTQQRVAVPEQRAVRFVVSRLLLDRFNRNGVDG